MLPETHLCIPSTAEPQRVREYARLRGNMPICQMKETGDPDQPYEATLMLVPHKQRDTPAQVIWHGGHMFTDKILLRDNQPGNCLFKIKYTMYGPVLFQAVLFFDDGTIETACIYCPVPGIFEDQSLSRSKEEREQNGK